MDETSQASLLDLTINAFQLDVFVEEAIILSAISMLDTIQRDRAKFL